MLPRNKMKQHYLHVNQFQNWTFLKQGDKRQNETLPPPSFYSSHNTSSLFCLINLALLLTQHQLTGLDHPARAVLPLLQRTHGLLAEIEEPLLGEVELFREFALLAHQLVPWDVQDRIEPRLERVQQATGQLGGVRVPEVKKLVAEVVEEGTEFVEVDDLSVYVCVCTCVWRHKIQLWKTPVIITLVQLGFCTTDLRQSKELQQLTYRVSNGNIFINTFYGLIAVANILTVLLLLN